MASRTFSDVKINVTYTPVTADNHATTDPSYVIVSGGNDHASNISSPQDLAKALGKIQNWYSNWHSVVWTGDAASVSGYTVATNVPSGALFTDEKVKQSLASANKNYPILFSYYETSNTTATPNAQTVNRVNTVYVNPSTGTVTATNFVGTVGGHAINADVPSDALFTDEKVTQTLKSDNKNYPLIFSYYETSNTTTTPANQGVNRVNTVYVNPSTGTVTATNFAGTVNGYTIAANVPSGALFTDEKVTQNIKSDNKNYPLLLSNYETTSSTTTAAAANRASGIYANPSTGTVTATNFAGTINGYTISGNVAKAVPSNAVFTDTTYTFTGGASGAYFQVTPSGGSAQTVYISGLGTMAFEASTGYIPTKPDGTHDLFDSSHVINSEYLPSYVDDVIEVIYDSATGKIYDPASPTTELTPETGKIYVDVSTPTKSDGPSYRWSGTAFISLKSPTVDGVADVVAGTNNGDITVSYNDGSQSSTFTVYTPEGNFIPSGGSTGQFLGYGGSSGTAVWTNIPSVSVFTGAPDASHAGTTGVVPAPAASTYNATKNRHYLRSDATWSDEPVTTDDILTLNVVAAT